MGKSYRRNDEYGNKYRGCRKSNKKHRKVRQHNENEIDDMWMRSFEESVKTD